MAVNNTFSYCSHDMLQIACARCRAANNPDAQKIYELNKKTFITRQRKIHPNALAQK